MSIPIILTIVFGVLAVLSLFGLLTSRHARGVFFWATASSIIASASAYYNVFWAVAAFGLMVPWALFCARRVLDLAWRVKSGLALTLMATSVLVIYPTFNDEILGAKIDESQLPSEVRAQNEDKAKAGELGLRRYLLSNMEFRLVRGLDLKGGLRLVYNVDVAEAIKDKRDGYYDDLKSSLAKAYGLSSGDEEPTPEQMAQLEPKLKIEKSRDDASTVIVNFVEDGEAARIINNDFLKTYLRELDILRDAGGKTVTFRIKNLVETYIRERAVTQAKETVLRRIDGLGLKEAAVSARDEDIIIEVPGDNEAEHDRMRDIIGQTARLEFKMVDDDVDYFGPIANTAKAEDLPPGLRFELEDAPVGVGKTSANHYGVLIKNDAETMPEALARFKEWTATLQLDDTHEIGFQKRLEYDETDETYAEVGWRTFYLKARAEITGDQIEDAQAQPDSSDTGFGRWYVSMDFSAVGGERFAEITEKNIKRRFAIILDGKVESAPVIQSKIAGGKGQITLGASNPEQQIQDARKLELVLKSGALPAPITPVKEDRIGPTLGQDSIMQGLKGGLIGGLLVLIAMVLYYSRAGFIANIAVMFNLVLQIAILSMFSASMTLPGIAGLALTMGIAVDANVLINERIREELRAGKTPRSAVDLGYEKAFSAIIDGQVTTLISGLILAQYGTGPIKGFAVTLIVGIGTSLFTGVVVTRLMFDWAVRAKKIKKLSLG